MVAISFGKHRDARETVPVTSEAQRDQHPQPDEHALTALLMKPPASSLGNPLPRAGDRFAVNKYARDDTSMHF